MAQSQTLQTGAESLAAPVASIRRGAPRLTLAERFWRHAVVGPECWGWNGSFFDDGYPRTSAGGVGGKRLRAHRVSYELHYGAIPTGMLVMHTCDNPPCTNPSHLVLGTTADNHADMWRKGRGKTPSSGR